MHGLLIVLSCLSCWLHIIIKLSLLLSARNTPRYCRNSADWVDYGKPCWGRALWSLEIVVSWFSALCYARKLHVFFQLGIYSWDLIFSHERKGDGLSVYRRVKLQCYILLIFMYTLLAWWPQVRRTAYRLQSWSPYVDYQSKVRSPKSRVHNVRWAICFRVLCLYDRHVVLLNTERSLSTSLQNILPNLKKSFHICWPTQKDHRFKWRA